LAGSQTVSPDLDETAHLDIVTLGGRPVPDRGETEQGTQQADREPARFA